MMFFVMMVFIYDVSIVVLWVGVCGRARVFACPYIHIYAKAHMLTFTPDVFLVYC